MDEYVKLKNEYIKLRNELKQTDELKQTNELKQTGGNKNIIIHITGCSGSGKTTLGKKLKNKYKNRIIVKDIDDLRYEFINDNYSKSFNWKSFNSKKFQKFIYDYINKQNKPIIFTGLNQIFFHNKNIYYNIMSDHNFFIDIDDQTIVKQKCIRFLTDELKDMVTKNKTIIRDITEDNEKFVRLIKQNIDRECGTKETYKLNKMWRRDYKKQNYIFMNTNDIYKNIKKIINHLL
jgi:uridine kinase